MRGKKCLFEINENNYFGYIDSGRSPNSVPMRIQGDGHLREREGEQVHP